VVLSSQRAPFGDAICTVHKSDVQAANPLVFDGQKLIPSVTRVFSKSRDLYVFLSVRVSIDVRAGRADDTNARRVRHVLSRRREGAHIARTFFCQRVAPTDGDGITPCLEKNARTASTARSC
jgi:hypothetical protein